LPELASSVVVVVVVVVVASARASIGEATTEPLRRDKEAQTAATSLAEEADEEEADRHVDEDADLEVQRD